MADGGDYLTTIRSLAVTARDVLAAYEATLQTDRNAVLRVTPPFSGRMRARLHVRDAVTGEGAAVDADTGRDGPPHIEIPPGDLLGEAPTYPHPDDTEDALRADSGAEFTRERHRERHEAALEEWRAAARSSIAESVAVETADGAHEVDVSVLGE